MSWYSEIRKCRLHLSLNCDSIKYPPILCQLQFQEKQEVIQGTVRLSEVFTEDTNMLTQSTFVHQLADKAQTFEQSVTCFNLA
jgi:hypothetical protein